MTHCTFPACACDVPATCSRLNQAQPDQQIDQVIDRPDGLTNQKQEIKHGGSMNIHIQMIDPAAQVTDTAVTHEPIRQAEGDGETVTGKVACVLPQVVAPRPQPAQPMAVPKYLKNWSLLAARALDDCHRVIGTIEAESSQEKSLISELSERIKSLFVQALTLHGLVTRNQLDKATPFGRIDLSDPTPPAEGGA